MNPRVVGREHQFIFTPGAAVDHPVLWGPNQALVKYSFPKGGAPPASEARGRPPWGSFAAPGPRASLVTLSQGLTARTPSAARSSGGRASGASCRSPCSSRRRAPRPRTLGGSCPSCALPPPAPLPPHNLTPPPPLLALRSGRRIQRTPLNAPLPRAPACTQVYDAERRKTDLVVVDAERVAEGPVATVHLRHLIPFGLHGSWADAYFAAPAPSPLN